MLQGFLVKTEQTPSDRIFNDTMLTPSMQTRERRRGTREANMELSVVLTAYGITVL